MTQPQQAQTAQAPQQPLIPLPLDLLNAVLEYLDTRPHRESRGLIDAIHSQVRRFQETMQQQQPEVGTQPPFAVEPLDKAA
jgi:hypothetical protein